MERKQVGILNKGKNNTFSRNKFENLDVGIQDEGEGTIAEENEFVDNTSTKQEGDNEEILKLSPEFYGVGINLKAFWKKIKNWFAK